MSNASAVRPNGNLASRQAKRQVRHLWIAAMGALLLVPAYFLAKYMAEQQWVTPLFSQTVLLCSLPYALAAQLLYRSIHVPAAEQRTFLLINTLLPFLLLVLGLALMQKSYSRGALLMITSLTLGWFWLAERLMQRGDKLQLLYLDEHSVHDLERELAGNHHLLEKHVDLVKWTACEDISVDCDGALVCDTSRLSLAQISQLTQVKQRHIRLYSGAAIAESLTGRKSMQVLSNLLWQPDGNPAYDTFKRMVDVVAVALSAPLWLPLGCLVALAIKIDSTGPVLFSQIRTGWHGRPFRIWKFRTMRPEQNAQARFADAGDERITRLGRFLRKSRLDEIPQLVNVLLGHMSLIGPRPEQHSFVNDFAASIPSYPYRHLVRPGLTGWAQVMQGYAASEEETVVKLRYDLYYVSHYSPALDLLILVKTLKTIFTGQGAR